MVDFGSPRLGLRPLATEPYGSPFIGDVSGYNQSSPRTAGDMFGNGPEVARRAAEWERQIETLDQKEMEIHQTQLRLIREQTTTFRGDLLALQQELVDLKAVVLKHATVHSDLYNKMDGRFSGSDRVLKDATDNLSRHAQMHQESERKLAQLQGSVNEHHRALSHHVTMKERMEYLERVVGDSADKHQRMFDEAHGKLDQLHNRLANCEIGNGEVKKSVADKDIKHSSVCDRVAYLEKLIGDNVDKHARELDALRHAHEKHVKDNYSRHSSNEQNHASVQGRLKFLENAVGDSAEKHAKELEAMKTSMGKLSGGLQAHATVAERLAFIEQALGDSAEKHAQELLQVHSKVDKMCGHTDFIEKLHKNHSSFAKELSNFGVHHANQHERLTYIEKVLGDSIEKHNRELDTIKSAHNKLASESKGHGQNHGIVADKVETAIRGHVSFDQRLSFIEKAVGDSVEKHAKELASLKAGHGSHSQLHKEQMAKHANLDERIEYVERQIGDSADKHASLVSTQQVKLEHLSGKITDEQKERLKQAADMHQQLQRHSTIEERLNYIEKVIGDSMEKHKWEIDQIKGAHVKLSNDGKAKHASIEDRMMYIENWFKNFKTS